VLPIKQVDMRIVGKNGLLASFWVTFNGFSVRALLINSSKGKFVSWPSEKYTKEDGTTSYRTLFSPEDENYHGWRDELVKYYENAVPQGSSTNRVPSQVTAPTATPAPVAPQTPIPTPTVPPVVEAPAIDLDDFLVKGVV